MNRLSNKNHKSHLSHSTYSSHWSNKSYSSYVTNRTNKIHSSRWSNKSHWSYLVLFSIFLLSYFLCPLSASASTLNKAPNNLGLVGYWSMNEGVGTKVGDSSGFANTGTITGATWTAGRLGKALDFSGNGYASIAGTNTNNFNFSSAVTIGFWMKGSTNLNTVILEKSNSNNHYHFQTTNEVMNNDGNHVLFGVSGTPSTGRVSSAKVVSDGNWHYVVGTFDSSANTLKIYIDGVLDKSNTGATDEIITNSQSLLIGSRSGTVGFPGVVDEVRIYNRALSATEVANLYKAGSVKMAPLSNIQGAQPVDESLPSNAVVGLVREDCTGYSYCATSLSAWQTMMLGGSGPIDWTGCTAGDLVCKNKIAVAKIDGSWSSPDTTNVNITGWVTDSTRYIKIYTTAQARHNGTRSPTKYRLVVSGTWAEALQMNVHDIRVDGLAVRSVDLAGMGIRFNGNGGGEFRLSNSIVYDCLYSGILGMDGVTYLSNVISMNNGAYGVYSYAMGAVVIYAYNSTAINNGGVGFATSAYRTLVCKNCYSGGNAGGDYVNESGLGSLTVTNSYSSDGTYSTSQIPLSTTVGTRFTNITPGSEDLHMKSMSTLKDKGANLSSDPYWLNASGNTDIDRQIRGAGNTPWDVGADEYPNSTKVSSSQNKTGTSLDTGLVGMWSFNGADVNWGTGTAYDRSGQGNNGIITNMSTTTSPVAGKLGQGLRFDGVNDYIRVAHNSNQNSLPLTISVWAKAGVVSQANNVAVVSKYPSSAQNGWAIDYVTNAYKFYYFKDSSNYIILGSGVDFGVGTTVWTHLVAVVDNTGARLYRDGTFVNSQGWTGTPGNPTQASDIQIGRMANGSLYWNGSLDEVRVYNRALSASEVKQLYLMGK